MELTLGRLKAALIAGKIPVTDEALVILQRRARYDYPRIPPE